MKKDIRFQLCAFVGAVHVLYYERVYQVKHVVYENWEQFVFQDRLLNHWTLQCDCGKIFWEKFQFKELPVKHEPVVSPSQFGKEIDFRTFNEPPETLPPSLEDIIDEEDL